jgi:ATP-dependent Clp protease protease subunit
MEEKINQQDIISIYNEDGTLKTKEEFLNLVGQTYDVMLEEESKNIDIFEELTNSENHIDVEQTLETFDFIERSIFIQAEITPDHANQVFELIKFWNKIDSVNQTPVEERIPIKIYINTPGGDLNAVFSIISSIKISQTPVHTITIGTGYSGGFFIGICGHKRFAYPYSSFLFHEGCSANEGDAHKFIQNAEFYKTQLSILKKITIDNTKIKETKYDKHRKDDWYFDAEEALKYGVIDEIITNFDKQGEI